MTIKLGCSVLYSDEKDERAMLELSVSCSFDEV